ncbi:hypothetical protein [Sedimenticola hydrogenitrophicus]|uniref:hypothetical protein n=1 Tax=Sedimenticola hydrogenitrophicus TaxID=2967975 RepID=UPI0023B0520D|nr:hypothetical protein [Sedimenticola hydrogenitrophicus]
MQLQINQNGAWRNCLSYPAARDAEVRYHAVRLARAADVKLRVLNDDGQVVTWWTADEGWTTPRRQS